MDLHEYYKSALINVRVCNDAMVRQSLRSSVNNKDHRSFYWLACKCQPVNFNVRYHI